MIRVAVHHNGRIMAARTTAWLVWALLAGSLVFWGLRLGAPAQGLPDQVRTVGTDQSARGDILRLFANPSDVGGAVAPAQPSAAASRLRLLGVVAGLNGAERGWAMLAVDGLPARMIAVGAEVVAGWVVQSVSPRQVEVGPPGGAPVAVLDLALPNAPQIGELRPPAGAAVSASPVAVAPPTAPVPPAMPTPPPGMTLPPPGLPQIDGQPVPSTGDPAAGNVR